MKPINDALNVWWFDWRTQNQFFGKYEYCIDFYWHEVLQMHYNRKEHLQLIIYSVFLVKNFCLPKNYSISMCIHHHSGLTFEYELTFPPYFSPNNMCIYTNIHGLIGSVFFIWVRKIQASLRFIAGTFREIILYAIICTSTHRALW